MFARMVQMAPPDRSTSDAGASPRLPVDAQGVRLRGTDMTRIETFTDAAFAFAVTLLVISIDAVPTGVPQLLQALEDVPAFALSFLQLALFWYAHWKWSRRYGLEDLTSVILSLFLVFVVLVYVYPLRYMFSLLVAWVSGGALGDPTLGSFAELNQVFLVYGIGFFAMSFTIALLYQHAIRRRHALGLGPLERLETRGERDVSLILAAIGALSAVLAAVTPPTTWGLPGWVYMLLPLSMGIYTHRFGRRRERLLESPDTAETISES